jgi:hypothetical protein
MAQSNIDEIKQTFNNARLAEEILEQAIIQGSIQISEIPEMYMSTSIAINAILMSSKHYFDIPPIYRSRELCLLIAQTDSKFYRDLESERILPIEIHSWVSSALSTPILSYFPPKTRTKAFSLRAISINARNVKYLPAHLAQDEDFLKTALQINASTLTYINENQVTKELVEIAFEQDDFDLEFVPLAFRTENLCLRAFEKNYNAIYSIPQKFITSRIVLKAIDQALTQELDHIVELTPDHLKNYDFWTNLVIKDSSTMRLVPENLIDNHFAYRVAHTIKKASHLKYIPTSILVNPTIINTLISTDPLLLEGIPKNYRDYMLCMNAVEKNGLALQFVPTSIQDAKIYLTAINQNALAMKYIPIPYVDENLPRIAVAKNGEAIEFVKEYYVDEDLCITAIKNNPRAIYFLPDRFKNDYEMNLLVIKTEGSKLEMVHERYRTIEVCRIALRKSYKNWKHIPIQMRSDAEIISLYNEYKKQGFLKDGS